MTRKDSALLNSSGDNPDSGTMTGCEAVRQTALTCRGHTRPVTFLAFSHITPDGYFLASACKDGRAMLRLGSTGDWIGTLEKHKGAVWCVSINPMATRAATASADHSVKLWDILNGHQLHQFDHKGIVKSVALSKNTTRLLTCGQDKSVFVYRLDRPSSGPEEIDGPEVGSRHVIWSPTEREIYVASEDGTLTLSDLRTSTEVWSVTMSDVIKDVHLTPDQSKLIVSHGLQADVLDPRLAGTCAEQPVSSYRLNCGVLSADLHPSEPYLVIGGDDHRLYKFEANESSEYEINRGHFGPIHAVRYSPDGELIASGSEDGTVRLWQHNIGKPYGLWRGLPPVINPGATLLEAADECENDEEDEVEVDTSGEPSSSSEVIPAKC